MIQPPARPQCSTYEHNSRPGRSVRRYAELEEVWEPHQSGVKFYLLPPLADALWVYQRCFVTPHPDPRAAKDAREFLPGVYSLDGGEWRRRCDVT